MPIDRVVEVRGEDVPDWLERYKKKGMRAIGLTGEDLYEEYYQRRGCASELNVLQVIEWDDPKAMFGKPALCLMGPKGKSMPDPNQRLEIWIASKYRNISLTYLAELERKKYLFNRVYVNGSVETGYTEGMADLVIDIVYTGSSLEKCGLEVLDVIMRSNFLVIGQDGEDLGEE